MIYGYARVSTDSQDLAAQLAALQEAGAVKVFREIASGIRADRQQLQRLLATLAPGDVVIVFRLDRLARSTRDLLNILATVSAKGAAFRSLAEAWADTTTPQGRLMVTILAGFAEFERALIAERTTEGRRRAKANGKRLGRKPSLSPAERQDIRKAIERNESAADLARRYRVHRSTIFKIAREPVPDAR